METNRFKPFFQELRAYQDVLDDAILTFKKRQYPLDKLLMTLTTDGREKIVKTEKEVQYIYTCVGIKKSDLSATIVGDELVIKGETTNIFGKTTVSKTIALEPTYDRNNVVITLEDGILVVKIGLVEPMKIIIEIK